MSSQTQWKALLKIVKKHGRRYAGKHVAMIDDKVVGVGKDEFALYKRIVKKMRPKVPIGLYYVPRPKDFMTLLSMS